VPAPKKVPQTDAIFARLNVVHQEAAAAPDTVRVSLDAKATINLGPFARGGRTRTGTKAVDHDFKPDGTLTPFGIFVPATGEVDVYFTSSKVSSDFIVDRLDDWWAAHRDRFAGARTLVIDLDNGPENSGQRSQFLYRVVCLAQKYQVRVRLAYYPPYHSKYNPIERCWGVLEMHWNGSLLDSIEAVLGFARTMTWEGKHPEVVLIEAPYSKGVRVGPKEMEELESQVVRLPSLEKWFVEIPSGAAVDSG
jgi:hypothetical protein